MACEFIDDSDESIITDYANDNLANSLTISIWNWLNTGHLQDAVSIYQDNGTQTYSQWWLYQQASNSMRTAFGAGVEGYHNGSTYYDKWRHWALTFSKDDDVVTQYIDGAEWSSTGSAESRCRADGIFRIAQGPNNREWDGRLAEVGVWESLLPVASIEALAAGIKPSLVSPSTLGLYMPMRGGSINDIKGAGLTNVTAPGKIDHPRMIG